MILDALDLPPQQDVLETDVCVVGSGPAALAIATGLSEAGARSMLLESGGFGLEPGAQDLNRGRVIGAAYDDLREVRCRRVGGTVNIWNTEVDGRRAAKYVPLDPIDLEARDWLPGSGWPFAFETLEPWYRKAQAFCGLGPLAYDATRWEESVAEPLRLDASLVESRVYQFGLAAPFLETAVSALEASERVRLLLHATVIELVTNRDADRVARAVIAVPGRAKRIGVRAGTFVLAAGAIENARLLLLSNGVRGEGLGNEHDLVGRFLMEHPRDYALSLIPARPTFFEEAAFYDQRRAADGTVVMGRLAVAEGALREARSLQASTTLLPLAPVAPRRSLLGRVARRLGLDRRGLDRPGLDRRWQGQGRPGYPRGAPGWSRRPGPARDFEGLRLLLNLEQAPWPDNRVVLAPECDAYGCRRAELHWTWTESEQRQLERTRSRFATALEGAGYGRVRIEASHLPDPNAHHHAGTTRMHADPRQGVVDPDGRVHGLENLYIAGASVFPTAGFANPTLTIVALGARLAEHISAAALVLRR